MIKKLIPTTEKLKFYLCFNSFNYDKNLNTSMRVVRRLD